MTLCIGVIPGCPDCLADRHGTHPGPCDDLCKLTRDMKQRSPETHRIIHEPRRCGHCQAVIDDKRGNDRTVTRPCANGTCRIWACPDCDGEVAGDGPVGCPVCSPIEGEFAEHVAVAQERLVEYQQRQSEAKP
jgi:hypothetical protein